MPRFTQLNLQSQPEEKSGRNSSQSGTRPAAKSAKLSGAQKAFAGLLITTTALGVFLLESGCSKSSSKPAVAIASPAPYVQAASAAAAAPQNQPAPATKPVMKKSRQHRMLAATYSNPEYGVSFRYPKPYSLKEGEQAEQTWARLSPAQMNFSQPGGQTISAVQLPSRSYAGTDFSAAFFNVSVNPKLNEKDCGQFAVSQQKQITDISGAPGVEPSAKRMGDAQYMEVTTSGDSAKNADARYYHVFQNDACYEFALGLKTGDDAAKAGVKVDRTEVFRRLNWMLSTVKIEPARVPAATPSIPAPATAMAASGEGKN